MSTQLYDSHSDRLAKIQRQTYSCPRDWRRSASWTTNQGASETLRTSRHHCIEGFKGDPDYPKRREPLGQQRQNFIPAEESLAQKRNFSVIAILVNWHMFPPYYCEDSPWSYPRQTAAEMVCTFTKDSHDQF